MCGTGRSRASWCSPSAGAWSDTAYSRLGAVTPLILAPFPALEPARPSLPAGLDTRGKGSSPSYARSAPHARARRGQRSGWGSRARGVRSLSHASYATGPVRSRRVRGTQRYLALDAQRRVARRADTARRRASASLRSQIDTSLDTSRFEAVQGSLQGRSRLPCPDFAQHSCARGRRQPSAQGGPMNSSSTSGRPRTASTAPATRSSPRRSSSSTAGARAARARRTAKPESTVSVARFRPVQNP